MKCLRLFMFSIVVTMLAAFISGCGSFSPDSQVSDDITVKGSQAYGEDDLTGTKSVSGWAWYYVAPHVHSTYSDGSWTVSQILNDVDGNDGSVGTAVNISDHAGEVNIPMPWTDAAFHETGSVMPVRGEEWGTKIDTDGNGSVDTETGHAVVFNINTGNNNPILVRKVVSGGKIKMGTYSNLLSDCTSRGALVWCAHPFSVLPGQAIWYPKNQGWNTGGWVDGLEPRMIGIEVWNWSWGGTADNQAAVDWWQSQLVRCTRHVAGLCGSDFHSHLEAAILGPCMRVYAASTSPADIETGIRNGRIIMVKDQTSARIYLRADTNNDGTYETIPGDKITATSAKTINYQVYIYGSGSSESIRIFTKAAGYTTVSSQSGAPYIYTFSKSYSANEKNFVRVELRQAPGSAYWPNGMANPIYVNF